MARSGWELLTFSITNRQGTCVLRADIAEENQGEVRRRRNEQAVDIGSNSIRLSLYSVNPTVISDSVSEKIMAGLAGYVEDGALSAESAARACSALLELRTH